MERGHGGRGRGKEEGGWPRYCLILSSIARLQVVMSPHAQAEEFISSYTKLMQDDSDINNFQKVLEMKVK